MPSDSGGVVSRIHLSPLMLLVGCCVLTVAILLTRRLAQRASNEMNGAELWLEIGLIGLVFAILAAVTLIAASLFDYV